MRTPLTGCRKPGRRPRAHKAEAEAMDDQVIRTVGLDGGIPRRTYGFFCVDARARQYSEDDCPVGKSGDLGLARNLSGYPT